MLHQEEHQEHFKDTLSIKQQLESLCGKDKLLLDLFYFATSHLKSPDYMKEILLMKAEKMIYFENVENVDFNSSFGLAKTHSTPSFASAFESTFGSALGSTVVSDFAAGKLEKLMELLLPLNQAEEHVDPTLLHMIWLLFTRSKNSIDHVQEYYKKNQNDSIVSSIISPQKDFNLSFGSADFNDRLSILNQTSSSTKNQDFIFGALTNSTLSSDTACLQVDLSLPRLGKLQPSLIKSSGSQSTLFENCPPLAVPSSQDLSVKSRRIVQDFYSRMDHPESVWEKASGNDGLDIAEEKNLKSWDMIQNSPGIKSPYLTECDWSVYTKVYESFKTHVFLSASDMPIISEAQLVDKLILACSGISSDCFVYNETNEKFECTVDMLRTKSIGYEALKRCMDPFLKTASDFCLLQNFALSKKDGLVTQSLCDSLNKVLGVVQTNFSQLRNDHVHKPMHILETVDAISPISFTLSFLSKIVLELDVKNTLDCRIGPKFLKSSLEIINTPITRHKDIVLPLLVFIIQGTSVPLVDWVNCWLMIPTTTTSSLFSNKFHDLDPFREFFIQPTPNDETQFKFDATYPFPEFLPLDLAKTLFTCGVWWRKMKVYRKDLDLNRRAIVIDETRVQVDASWTMDPLEFPTYNAKIEEYCAARLNEWRTSTISIHLEYLSQLDQEHHLKVLELEQKRESLHLETIQKAEIEHKVQLKRQELKDAIESFLEERRTFKMAQKVKQDQETAKSIQADQERQALADKSYKDEMDDLYSSFEVAFKRLEKKEAALEWRRRRLFLDASRREYFKNLETVTLDCDFTIPFEENSQVANNAIKTVPLDPVLDSVSALVPEELLSTEEKVEDELSFHSADESDAIQNEPESIQMEQQEKSVQFEDEQKTNDLIHESVEEPSEMNIEVNVDLKETASISTQDEDTTESFPSSIDNDANDIEWVLYPGTVHECFGKPNQLKRAVKSTEGTFDSINNISASLKRLESSLIPIKHTFDRTLVQFWKKQMDIVSFGSASCFFSLNGGKNDLRYHLQIIKDYFLFGSVEFKMVMADRLFRCQSYRGLDLNGSDSNIAWTKIDVLFRDVFARDLKLDQFDVQVDGARIKIGDDIVSNLRLMYKAPSPFDIIFNPSVILKYSEIFTLLLQVLQAQDALERIRLTEKWKQQKKVSRESGEACIITDFLHKSRVFLLGLQRYVFESCIEAPWKDFSAQLDEIAKASSIMKFTGHQTKLETLVDAHGLCLDEIYWRLFGLHDEQKIVQNHILKLVSIIISFGRAMQGLSKQSIPQLFFSFQSTHQSFLRLLKDVVVQEEFSGKRYPSRQFSFYYELYYSITGMPLM